MAQGKPASLARRLGELEKREAFTRVGVKVWSMVPWLRQGPGVRLWGHAMPNWQRGLCQYPEPRAQSPHLRPVGLLLEWDGTGTGTGTRAVSVL